MQLTFQVTRLNPGNRQPFMNAASIFMSFGEEELVRNYSFRGEATLSFTGGQLIDEHSSIEGSLYTLPIQTRYCGIVTYSSLQGSTPHPSKAWPVRSLAISSFQGPCMFHATPVPAVQQRLIQPTHQQLHNQEMVYVRGHILITMAFSLIIAQESWP